MDYALGTSDFERRRLELQGALMERFTRTFLCDAGVAPGKRVLDVGSGAGDVSLLISELVGPSGHVTGVDIEPRMVEHARLRLQAADVDNATFRHVSADLGEIEDRYDVVVGRLVATFQPDPVAFIRRAAALVAPGGFVGFIEPGFGVPAMWSQPEIPAYDRLVRRFLSAMNNLGVSTSLGAELVRTFVDAGLPSPKMSANFHVGDEKGGNLDLMLLNMQIGLTQARRRGVACPMEEEFQQAVDHIRRDAARERVQFMGPLSIGAYAQVA